MSTLPPLRADGAVVFATAGELADTWDRYLDKGALPVRPEQTLAPLQRLDVRLIGGGLLAPVDLRAEVVHLEPERALLRLLDPAPKRPATVANAAFVAVAAAGAPERSSSTSGLPSAQPLVPPRTITQTQHQGRRPPALLAGPVLAFAHVDDLNYARDALESTGSVMALPQGGVVVGGEVALELRLGPLSHPAPLFASLREQGRAVVVTFSHRDRLLESLRWLVARAASAAERVTEPPAPAATALPVVVAAPDALAPPAGVGDGIQSGAADDDNDPLEVSAELPELQPLARTPTPIPAPTRTPTPVAIGSVAALASMSGPGAAAGGMGGTASGITGKFFGLGSGDGTPGQGTPRPSDSMVIDAARNVLSSALPPYFTGEALRFASMDDLRGAREHMVTVGAVIAVADAMPMDGRSLEVRIIVGSLETRQLARCATAPAATGSVVVQALERGGFLPLLQEIDAAVTGAPGAYTPPAGLRSTPAQGTPASGLTGPRIALSLPREGELQNPTSAEQILLLPVNRPPSEADIRSPSVALLLRWLRTQRGTLKVEFAVEGHPVHNAIFVDGREVRTPVSLQALGRALSQPRATYKIVELPKAPQMTTHARTLHLISEVLRGLVSRCEVEDLQRAFPDHGAQCPRAQAQITESLGLPPTHQRLIKASLQGTERVDEIIRNPTGARAAWDCLYILEMYGALVWEAAAEKTSPRGLATASPGRMVDAWASFEGKDHFGVLGLHWSSSPAEIEPAAQRAKLDYAPGGPKRPADRATADRILERIEEARRVLMDPQQRRAYRQVTYNLVWSHQAQLLISKAKLALYRKDLGEARGVLLAAQDIFPTSEAAELLATITKR